MASDNGKTSFTVSEFYKDPEADLVIHTKDNFEMRIESYHLKSQSTVFRDMISTAKPSNLPINSNSYAHVITLDADHAGLKWIFDVITRKHEVARLGFSGYASALKLCDQYGLENVTEVIIGRLLECAHQAPLKTLVIASRFGRFNLARHAVKHLDNDPLVGDVSFATLPVSIFHDIDSVTTARLMKAIVAAKVTGSTMRTPIYWSKTAEYFRQD